MSAAMFFEGLRRVTKKTCWRTPVFLRSRACQPGATPTGGLAFDDDMMSFDRAQGWPTLPAVMFLFASRFRDPEAQRYALYEGFDPPGAEQGKFYPGGRWHPERREHNGHWEYLWCDESVPVQDPPGDSPSALLPSTGWAILRSGWKPTDTYLAFRSGPYLGHHDRYDQNKIVLQAGGEKLLEHLYRPTTCTRLLQEHPGQQHHPRGWGGAGARG